MPRRGKGSKPSYGQMTGNPYDPKPLPSGVPRPMCFCGNPCKVDISKDEETYRQRYWMCSNFAWEPTERQRRSTFITPPPLCDFEQWIDTKIKESTPMEENPDAQRKGKWSRCTQLHSVVCMTC